MAQSNDMGVDLDSVKSSGEWCYGDGIPFRCAVFLIVAATGLAYSNSFKGVFQFDDHQNIKTPQFLSLPYCLSFLYIANNRCLVYMSMVLNYLVNGFNPWGYHAVNLLIHLIAGLALFGIVRRTLLMPILREKFGAQSTVLAAGVATLFLLHPLQTESVTYISQRAQAMMGMFQLLALYCVVRGFESPRKTVWHLTAAFCCILGLDAKPHMIGMPLLVLLYDRTFVSASFREAWRRSRVLYYGLLWVWVVNVGNLGRGLDKFDLGDRGAYADAGSTDMTMLEYARSQFYAICLYLKLSFWPHPLSLDYGLPIAKTLQEIVPYAVVVISLGVATLWGIWRRSAWGFVGAWFFLNIGPSSSIIRRPDIAVEHRMYAPLAAIIVIQIIGGYLLARAALTRISPAPHRYATMAGWWVMGAFICAAGAATFLRNEDYSSELRMWKSAVAVNPGNSRAQRNLGKLYLSAGNVPEAEAHLNEALRLNPDNWQAHFDLGVLKQIDGKRVDALAHYLTVLEYTTHQSTKENLASLYNEMGAVWLNQKKYEDAEKDFHSAVAYDPQLWDAHYNLGLTFTAAGNFELAGKAFKRVLEIKPGYDDARSKWAEAEFKWGLSLFEQELLDGARDHFNQALKLRPDYSEASEKLAQTQAKIPDLDKREARMSADTDALLKSLQADPANETARDQAVAACNNLGRLLQSRGKFDDAAVRFKVAIAERPKLIQSYSNLALALEASGKREEAAAQLREAVRLDDSNMPIKRQLASVLDSLGTALRVQKKNAAAETYYREALKMSPYAWKPHYHLAILLSIEEKNAEAFRECELAVKLNPMSVDAAILLQSLR